MHEFVLTENIIDEVTAIAKDNPGNKVILVTLGFGPFTHASFESIEFWWNTLIADSSLQSCKLIKQDIKGKLYCPSCDQEFIIENRIPNQFDEYLEIFACPNCNSYQTKILDGTEILILNLEIESIEEIDISDKA